MFKPSVIALLVPDHASFAQIGRVPQTTAMVDEAISAAYENGDDFAELDLSAFDRESDPSSATVRDLNFLMNLLPDGFGKMSARLPSGAVVTGGEFARLLTEVARATKSSPASPEAKGATVFMNVDLRMLRALPSAERPAIDRPQG